MRPAALPSTLGSGGNAPSVETTREPMRVLITVKKRGWCGELATIVLGARGLVERGHDVTVAHNVGSDVVARLKGSGAALVPIDFRRTPGRWDVALRTRAALRRLLRERRIDVVEAHASWDHWVAATARAGMRRAPGLMRLRHNRKRIARHPPNRWLYTRGADLFMTQTQAVRDDILVTGFVRPDKVAIVGSAIDVERYAPDPGAGRALRAELGIPEGAWVIGYAGRLSERKRVDVLVEAHRLLRRGRDDDPWLMVAGWGDPEHTACVREAARRDERVRFLGRRDDPERCHNAADVVALASRAESFPRGVLEAMACGKVTVTGPESGLARFVTDGVEARVLEDDSPAAFAEALDLVRGRPAELAATGAAARRLVESGLSVDSYVRRLERGLRRAAGTRLVQNTFTRDE